MSTKVVYNACFGGFSLSLKAAYRLRELGISTLDDEIKYAEKKTTCKNSIFLDGFCDVTRHDPRLIQVVEELGDEANGQCAKLCIEEIDTERYRIEEYDGKETVVTSDDYYDWVKV